MSNMIQHRQDCARGGRSPLFAAQVIVSTACKTAGEALREIDIKDIIKSDFVLVSGDVVSNMDLGAALEAHKARRDRDKNALMTMVCPLRPRSCPGSCSVNGCRSSVHMPNIFVAHQLGDTSGDVLLYVAFVLL